MDDSSVGHWSLFNTYKEAVLLTIIQASSDKRGPRYVGLMRTIYRLANMSTSAPRLTMNLLQTLFINLKDDALAFLAGIWINCTPKNNNDDLLVTVALRHAVAFLEAHIAEDGGMDFQTIFPAFLVALQSESVDIRQAALACISCLRRLADRQFTAVYRFDTIYGQSESECDSKPSFHVHLIRARHPG